MTTATLKPPTSVVDVLRQQREEQQAAARREVDDLAHRLAAGEKIDPATVEAAVQAAGVSLDELASKVETIRLRDERQRLSGLEAERREALRALNGEVVENDRQRDEAIQAARDAHELADAEIRKRHGVAQLALTESESATRALLADSGFHARKKELIQSRSALSKTLERHRANLADAQLVKRPSAARHAAGTEPGDAAPVA